MKKTIIASSLAVGLGVVGNAGHADASEAQVNKAELAQLAQSNDQSLNDSPIQEGAYNVTFDYEGFTYHFESDGTNWRELCTIRSSFSTTRCKCTSFNCF